MAPTGARTHITIGKVPAIKFSSFFTTSFKINPDSLLVYK